MSKLSVTICCSGGCWAESARQDVDLAGYYEEHACAGLAFHDDYMPSLHRALVQHEVELRELPGVAAFKDGYLAQESKLLSCRLKLHAVITIARAAGSGVKGKLGLTLCHCHCCSL